MIGGPWFERLLMVGIVSALALIAYAALRLTEVF